MSLNHDFILISNPKNDNIYNLDILRNDKGKPIIKGVEQIDIIDIDDSLISYINDFFNWIPVKRSVENIGEYGINYYGITCFTNENSILTAEMFKTLADLFSFAPEKIYLKGDFCWVEEEIESGKYEVLEFNKKIILKKFKTLASWKDTLLLDGNTHIIHLGV